MSAERIRVAVVGLNFGALWASCYRDHPDVADVVLCDTDRERLDRVGDSCGIPGRLDTLEQVLAADDIDAVHLLTPIPLHAEQSAAVLASGRHCACAVPMAVRVQDVEAIVRARNRSGKNYMLMETENYSRTSLYARKLHDHGAFGELQLLRGVHFQNMEGWPHYWRGMPPMYYASHGLGPVLGIAGAPVSRVRCLGSGVLPKHLQGEYENPYPVETALMELQDSPVICEVCVCHFEMVREFLVDRFCVYGNRMSMESSQIAGGPPVLFEARSGPLDPDQRGRPVSRREARVPKLSELVDPAVAHLARKDESSRVLGCVHEFVRSIVERRPASMDIRWSANLTAAGIRAHESALRGGAAVDIPAFCL